MDSDELRYKRLYLTFATYYSFMPYIQQYDYLNEIANNFIKKPDNMNFICDHA